jgi:hypothetical protein
MTRRDHLVDIKVGDELAFKVPPYDSWYIKKIDRTTPSGILVCGDTKVRVSVNGGLSVVGESGWSKTLVVPATDEIRIEAKRSRMFKAIEKTKWRDLDNNTLAQVYSIVHASKSSEANQ